MARTGPNKKAMRYAAPVAAASAVVASIGLVPVLADNGDPDLPDITAEELVAKVAGSDVEQLSGTVQVSADLGLPGPPALPGDTDSEAADPHRKLTELVTGEHTLEVAMDGPEKHRVDIVDGDEYNLVHNEREFWAYDSASNSALRATGPEDGRSEKSHMGRMGLDDMTPGEAAEEVLDTVDDTTSVTVDGTMRVADRDAYQLVLKPKNAPDSTVDAVRIAVDAENGVPLKFTVAPKGGGRAAFQAGFTEVDFAEPAAGTFDFTPPSGAKVTEADEWEKPHHGDGERGEGMRGDGHGDINGMDDLEGLDIIGEGWDAVAEIKPPTGKNDGDPDSSPEAERFLDAFTEKAEGDFGTGRVFSTRLVNVLLTEDGAVYAGAVTKEGLIKAADESQN
jgi:outer membrane lipoprotein-sorting protein